MALSLAKNAHLRNGSLLWIVLVFVALALTLVNCHSALAAGPGASVKDNLTTYCKSKLPAKIESVCNGVIIDEAFYVAQQKCDSSGTASEQAKCIEQKAKGYINDAASKFGDASSADAFRDKFESMLSTKGVDIKPPTVSADSGPGGSGKDPALEGCKGNNSCDFVGKYVNPAINLLTFSFGLIAVISLILGGIQYSASGGDPQNVAKAKKRITDTLIAVVAFFFLYAFLQFLIPGGLFHK